MNIHLAQDSFCIMVYDIIIYLASSKYLTFLRI